MKNQAFLLHRQCSTYSFENEQFHYIYSFLLHKIRFRFGFLENSTISRFSTKFTYTKSRSYCTQKIFVPNKIPHFAEMRTSIQEKHLGGENVVNWGFRKNRLEHCIKFAFFSIYCKKCFRKMNVFQKETCASFNFKNSSFSDGESL